MQITREAMVSYWTEEEAESEEEAKDKARNKALDTACPEDWQVLDHEWYKDNLDIEAEKHE